MMKPAIRILGLVLALLPAMAATAATSGSWGKCPAKVRDLVDQCEQRMFKLTRDERFG